MSHKGYAFESELEDVFLSLTGQTKQDAIFNDKGEIHRTFRVPTSGAMACLKGDVRTCLPFLQKQWLIEAKARTEKTKKYGRQFPLELEWFSKIIEEGKGENRIPVVAISFKGARAKRVWLAFLESDYNTINFIPTPISTIFTSEENKKRYLLRHKDIVHLPYFILNIEKHTWIFDTLENIVDWLKTLKEKGALKNVNKEMDK
jgi:hypothetical protein